MCAHPWKPPPWSECSHVSRLPPSWWRLYRMGPQTPSSTSYPDSNELHHHHQLATIMMYIGKYPVHEPHWPSKTAHALLYASPICHTPSHELVIVQVTAHTVCTCRLISYHISPETILFSSLWAAALTAAAGTTADTVNQQVHIPSG